MYKIHQIIRILNSPSSQLDVCPFRQTIFTVLWGMELQPDYRELLELARAKMPFGKFKDRYLSDLPEYYLVWFRQKGFPPGKLGRQMQQVFEMQLNGMEQILRNIRQKYPPSSR